MSASCFISAPASAHVSVFNCLRIKDDTMRKSARIAEDLHSQLRDVERELSSLDGPLDVRVLAFPE